MLTELRGLPAPAKLNLFLHVTGRRPDGYHDLETVFQFIELADQVDLIRTDDGQIRRLPAAGSSPALAAIPESDDLTLKAARALQAATGCRFGAAIGLTKRIPVGAGLGGGSSDAATTLIGLNRLWHLDLPRAALIDIARPLGADVPVFVFGDNAWATGTGDVLTALDLPAGWFVLVMPPVSVPTAGVFADPKLTRNTEPLTIEGFSRSASGAACYASLPGRNDLQPVVCRQQPAVVAALRALETARQPGRDDPKRETIPATVRMTGSGACVFAALDDEASASALFERLVAGHRHESSTRQRTLSRPQRAVANGQDPADADGAIFGVAVPNVGKVWLVHSLARHPLGSSQVG